MNVLMEKRKKPETALFCACCLLMTAGLIVLSLSSHAPAASPVIAQADGYTIERSAPALTGPGITISRRTLLQGTLMLVSGAHPLPKDFPPPDTRSVRALVGSYLPASEETLLCQEAVYALCRLQTDHSLHGLATLENGAVSAAQQEQLRQEAFERYRKVYPLSEAVEKAHAAVPGGGESEHQLGYAVDIYLTGPLALGSSDPLLRTETGKWLSDNLWRYGFIRRYNGSSGEEGACEHIHLRFVGTFHAAAMHALHMTLEEYLALLRAEGSLTLAKDGQPVAYFYCAPCQGSWTLPLPANAAVTCSADNTGWAIAAVEIRK